jgi:hypothetical protein
MCIMNQKLLHAVMYFTHYFSVSSKLCVNYVTRFLRDPNSETNLVIYFSHVEKPDWRS